ncbi:MAG: tetratricopeptide repeat protein [bacterium]
MDKKMKHKAVINLIKRNEMKEMLDSTLAVITKNTQNTIIASIVVLVVLIAIPFYLNHKNTMEIKAEQLVSRANMMLTRPVLNIEQAGMYGYFRTTEEKTDMVIKTYAQVLKEYKGTNQVAYATLGMANAYYNLGKYKEAQEYFMDFAKKYPTHKMIDDARSGLGYVLYQIGQFKEAAVEFEKVGKTSFVYYDAKLKLAECYAKTGDKVKAKAAYEEIVKDSADTKWASVAREALKKTN